MSGGCFAVHIILTVAPRVIVQAYFSMTVDFTDETLGADRVLSWGPGLGLDGTLIMLLVGDESTIFFSQTSDNPERKIGSPCPKTKVPLATNLCDPSSPVSCLKFDDPLDKVVYACNGTITGSVYLDYVAAETNSTASD